MNGLPWFRLYAEMPHDERIEEIAFEDRWHYVNVLCMQCSGLLDKEFQTKRMRERKIARELGLDSDTAEFVKERLIDVGLIDDKWHPKGWEKRQLVSDHDPSNAARQRRFREKKKKNNAPVTLRNVTVTGVDTDTDTDTDTEVEVEKEKEKEKKPSVTKKHAIPADIDKELWTEFMKSRKRLKASSSDVAIKILLTTLDKCVAAGFTRNEAISEAIERGWKSVKPEWLKNSVKSSRSFAEQKEDRRKSASEAFLRGSNSIDSTCQRVQ